MNPSTPVCFEQNENGSRKAVLGTFVDKTDVYAMKLMLLSLEYPSGNGLKDSFDTRLHLLRINVPVVFSHWNGLVSRVEGVNCDVEANIAGSSPENNIATVPTAV